MRSCMCLLLSSCGALLRPRRRRTPAPRCSPRAAPPATAPPGTAASWDRPSRRGSATQQRQSPGAVACRAAQRRHAGVSPDFAASETSGLIASLRTLRPPSNIQAEWASDDGRRETSRVVVLNRAVGEMQNPRRRSARSPAPRPRGDRYREVSRRRRTGLSYNGHDSGNRYSALAQIAASNASRLVPKWILHAAERRGPAGHASGRRRGHVRQQCQRPLSRSKQESGRPALELPSPAHARPDGCGRARCRPRRSLVRRVLVDATSAGAAAHGLARAGQPQRLLIVLDRTSRRLPARDAVGEDDHWASGLTPAGRPIVVPNMEPTREGKRVCPSLDGASNWYSASYNPRRSCSTCRRTTMRHLHPLDQPWTAAGASWVARSARRPNRPGASCGAGHPDGQGGVAGAAIRQRGLVGRRPEHGQERRVLLR